MEVVTAHARDADRKKITGALLGGSTRRLMVAEEYIGLPNGHQCFGWISTTAR
jgi:hypothetical protein